MEALSPRTPEVGQLAHVRGKPYVTLDIDVELAGTPEERHIVKLSSVDDAVAKPLTVIWQVEPNASAVDFDELPHPEYFDEPETLDAFLNAARWGIVGDIDRRTYLAPFRSGIKIEDYQLDPLV